MVSRSDLYNLKFEDGEAFKAFDPADYTVMRGYTQNKVFSKDELHSLLRIANDALKCFTCANKEYEIHLEVLNTRVPDRRKKKLEKEGKYPAQLFGPSHQAAFELPRHDFEEAVRYCCELLQSEYSQDEWKEFSDHSSRSGANDTEYLDRAFFGDCTERTTTEKEAPFEYHRLMAAFTLWKLDKTALAIQNGWAKDVACLLVDAQNALSKAEHPHALKIHDMQKQREVSGRSAKSAKHGPKRQRQYKDSAIALYKSKSPWKSWENAANSIYGILADDFKPIPISSGEAHETMRNWFKEIDPNRKYIKE